MTQAKKSKLLWVVAAIVWIGAFGMMYTYFTMDKEEIVVYGSSFEGYAGADFLYERDNAYELIEETVTGFKAGETVGNEFTTYVCEKREKGEQISRNITNDKELSDNLFEYCDTKKTADAQ